MFDRYLTLSAIAAALACAIGAGAHAETITQGFEGGGFTLYAQNGGDTAALATSPVHSGTYSANIAVASGQDDAEVDNNITGNGLTLSNLTSANYWVYLASGSNSNAPYLYLAIATPGGTAYVVMFNPADIGISLLAGAWTDIQVDPNTTAFHVEGNTTGVSNPGGLTLAQLSATVYSPGVSWGSFAIDSADIEVGQEGDNLPSAYDVDDLTISDSVPEPASMALLGVGAFGLGAVRRRKKGA